VRINGINCSLLGFDEYDERIKNKIVDRKRIGKK
jgi:hypothetical protein